MEEKDSDNNREDKQLEYFFHALRSNMLQRYDLRPLQKPILDKPKNSNCGILQIMCNIMGCLTTALDFGSAWILGVVLVPTLIARGLSESF
jgi:hypothetical protein